VNISKVIEFSARGPLVRTLTALVAAVAMTLTVTATAQAQSQNNSGAMVGESYVPTIWVDPDGCEHWVMDDGAEGYMSPHVRRDGTPVCRRGNLCGTLPADQFFATDKYSINAAGQQRLREFFRTAGARSYIITGHTDSRASDAYNMRLSINRANAVARVARSTGAKVADVRGYGERSPRVPNTSAANMAQNRRVEIICVQ